MKKLKFKETGEIKNTRWNAVGKSKAKNINYEISSFIHGFNNYKLICKHEDGKEEFWQYFYLKGAMEDAQAHWEYHNDHSQKSLSN